MERIKKIPGIEKVTLTTNGVALGECLEELIRAGIDGINISLDTLDAECYRKITGRDCLDKVLESIRRAASFGIPVKVNAVSLDLGDENWKELIKLGESHPVDVRFIEMMPIVMGRASPLWITESSWRKCRQSIRIWSRLQQAWIWPCGILEDSGISGKRRIYQRDSWEVLRGLQPCTADIPGILKSCLCYEDGVDLRPILREKQSGRSRISITDGPKNCPRMTKPCRGVCGRQWPGLSAISRKRIVFERPQDITEEADMIAIGG